MFIQDTTVQRFTIIIRGGMVLVGQVATMVVAVVADIQTAHIGTALLTIIMLTAPFISSDRL